MLRGLILCGMLTLTAFACAFASASERPKNAPGAHKSEKNAPGAQGSHSASGEPAPKAQVTQKKPKKAPSRASEEPEAGNATAKAKGAKGSPEAPAAQACSKGMQLVSGQYCTEVKHECERSWYDASNKKTVCEAFKEGSGTCVGEKEEKRFCIDTYAWPNQAGERPEVMNRFHQAQVKCAAVGKRLCSESEWTFACEGPDLKPFPYGYERDTNKCHGDVAWDGPNMRKVAARDEKELSRLWKGVRSGSQKECVSDFGVYDLPGNTDEVVSSETFSKDWRGKYDSVHTGGPWYKGVRNQCRPKIYTHDEGFYYYFLSFRCCSEADGKETEPRTKKQVQAGWDFSRVERSAGFSRKEYKALLERKQSQPDCGCSAKDIRCRTMCGTLLGPEARDYEK